MRKKLNWSWIAVEAAKRKLSIGQVALHIGVSETALQNLVHGRSHNPKLETALKLAYLFTAGSLDRLVVKAGGTLDDWLEMDGEMKFAAASSDADGLLSIQISVEQLLNNAAQPALPMQDQVIASNRVLFQRRRYHALEQQARHVLGALTGKNTLLSAQMLCDVATAENMLGNFPQAIEAGEKALEADYGEPLTLALEADIHSALADIRRSISDLTRAREHCEQVLRLSDRAHMPRFAETPAWAEWNLIRIAALEGKLSEAMHHCDTTKDLAHRGRHADIVALEIWARANVHELRGNLALAITLYQEARERCHHLDYLMWEACSDWRIAECLRKQGKLAAALTLAQATARTYAELGNPNLEATMWLISAAVHLQQGRLQAARQLYQQAGQQAKIDGDRWMQHRTQTNLQLIRFAQEARKPNPDFRAWWPAARSLPEVVSSWSLQTYDALFGAEALRLSGHADVAHARFLALAQQRERSGHLIEQAHALLGAAESKRLLGQNDRATVQQALDIYRKASTVWGQIHAHVTLALLEASDSGLAAPHLQQAVGLANEAGMMPEQRFIHRLQQTPEDRPEHVMLFV